MIKRPINTRHIRKALPAGFGWIDHRLLRNGLLARPGAQALGLYCVLLCASDHQGLSYYSQDRLCCLLHLDPDALVAARRALCQAGLIAYSRPLYQVLAFDPDLPTAPACEQPRHAAGVCEPPVLPAGADLRALIAASLSQGGVL
jgi:hypothetical protein